MPDLAELVALFFDDPRTLATFRRVEEQDMPPVARELLAHDSHMTVTVESYHRSPVRVHVLQTLTDGPYYAREILLRRTSDDRVVQFGIVRLDTRVLSDLVRDEILSQRQPLGRVLIEHDVLRKVECVALWEVSPGPRLQSLLGLRSQDRTYGRTALIHCNGEPAVELLEIVTCESRGAGDCIETEDGMEQTNGDSTA